MKTEQGNLSISSENIFPIIKRWLYNDQDIFIRELISNGCDAITKLRKLEIMGEYQFPEDNHFEIQVIVNPQKKTISFLDNGIGMTADEVKEYINRIAFSGATDFLNQYKDKANDDQIIGHFGLGFYSAFMVADKVTIDSLSYKEGAKAVHWECDGSTTFSMGDSDKENVGTEVTLYLNDDCYEYSNEYRVREVLEKYCSFMPEEIYLVNTEKVGKEEPAAEGGEEGAQAEAKEPVPVNDPHPLWTKHPNECTKEDYIDFYRQVFRDYKEPLFWIHLNMDYPFNLKGILYFPKLTNQYDTMEGTIKLYNSQVFIADNIKEVIPEFLLLLKGVIDCPDLPLNVSRSALQNDGFVTKISDYITKKVADKLSGMFKTEREEYEKYWDDISPFIKYGCLKDEKFSEKMDPYVLFRNMNDKYLTLEECLEENKDKHENTVFYITDRRQQGQYIEMFKKAKQDAVYMEHLIDASYISMLESKKEGLKFLRIDSDLDKTFTKRTSKKDQEELDKQAESIQERLRKLTGNEKLEVQLKNLKNADTSSMLTVSEEAKRMEDMMMQMGMMGMDGPDLDAFKAPGTLVLNNNHELVQYVLNHEGDAQTDESDVVLEQLYDLARIANGPLSPAEMAKFIARSNRIMVLLTK